MANQAPNCDHWLGDSGADGDCGGSRLRRRCQLSPTQANRAPSHDCGRRHGWTVSAVPKTVLDKQLERLRAMTAEEKIRASESLRAAAWAMKAAWIRKRNPDLSEAEVQEEVRHWISGSTS
jgi:hypothetical protein